MLLKSPNKNSRYLVVFVVVVSQFHQVYIVVYFEYNEMIVVVVLVGLVVVNTDIHIEVDVWELYMRIVFELVVDNEPELLEIHP
jgi:hypothetical protein